MAKWGPHRRVQYRRRREGKTNYRGRLNLLRSGKPRFVVRTSLRHIRTQVTDAVFEGDRTWSSAFSKELPKFGWRGYTGNTPAAYLVGLLCGFRTNESGISECVLDLDRHVPTAQSKVFAAVKGALDAGLNIPHNEEILPSDGRVKGEHIANYARELKSDNEGYRSQFADYLRNDLLPEKIPEHFEQVKKSIVERYSE